MGSGIARGTSRSWRTLWSWLAGRLQRIVELLQHRLAVAERARDAGAEQLCR